MNRWYWIALALVIYGSLHWYRHRPLQQPDGVLVADDPAQVPLHDAPAFEAEGGLYRIQPLATFDIGARVLSREDYHFDRLARLVPVDLALGWGAMSDGRVLRQLNISQGGRFFFWHADVMPLPLHEIIAHASNMHLIAANAEIKDAIRHVRPGQLVHFDGELVEVQARDGWTIRSSLTRDDTGAGACEVVWVEHFGLQ